MHKPLTPSLIQTQLLRTFTALYIILRALHNPQMYKTGIMIFLSMMSFSLILPSTKFHLFSPRKLNSIPYENFNLYFEEECNIIMLRTFRLSEHC